MVSSIKADPSTSVTSLPRPSFSLPRCSSESSVSLLRRAASVSFLDLAVHVGLQNAVLRSSEAHIRASKMLRPCRRLTPHHARTFCKCRGLDGDHQRRERRCASAWLRERPRSDLRGLLGGRFRGRGAFGIGRRTRAHIHLEFQIYPSGSPRTKFGPYVTAVTAVCTLLPHLLGA